MSRLTGLSCADRRLPAVQVAFLLTELAVAVAARCGTSGLFACVVMLIVTSIYPWLHRDPRLVRHRVCVVRHRVCVVRHCGRVVRHRGCCPVHRRVCIHSASLVAGTFVYCSFRRRLLPSHHIAIAFVTLLSCCTTVFTYTFNA